VGVFAGVDMEFFLFFSLAVKRHLTFFFFLRNLFKRISIIPERRIWIKLFFSFFLPSPFLGELRAPPLFEVKIHSLFNFFRALKISPPPHFFTWKEF